MAVINGKEITLIKNDAQAKAVTLEEGRNSQKVKAGEGLLMVLKRSKAGKVSKSWAHPFKHNSKGREEYLGTFNPESKKHVSIAAARKGVIESNALQVRGINPIEAKKLERAKEQAEQAEAAAELKAVEQAKQQDENTFEVIARRWHTSTLPKRSLKDAAQILRRLENEIFPTIGNTPITNLTRAVVMDLLVGIYHSKKADGTERNDLARRIALNVRAAFDYAVDLGLIDFIPMGKINKLMPPPIHKHHPAIKDSKELGKLLRDIDAYGGTYPVCMALKILPFVVFRNTEFRSAEWTHIDFERMEWVIPSENRKQKTAFKADPDNFHIVPLPTQAIALLKELYALTGNCKYVFDRPTNKEGFLSENAINQAFHRMGYKGKHCGHGWRTTFSSIQKDLGMDRDLVETQLSHVVEGGEVRRAYLQNNFLKQRVDVAQRWANYLDGLRNGADVIAINRREGSA